MSVNYLVLPSCIIIVTENFSDTMSKIFTFTNSWQCFTIFTTTFVMCITSNLLQIVFRYSSLQEVDYHIVALDCNTTMFTMKHIMKPITCSIILLLLCGDIEHNLGPHHN